MNEVGTVIDSETGELIDGNRAAYWAEVIREDWRKTVQGVLDTGQHLIEAKGELSHGEWGKLTGRADGHDGMLPFSHVTAYQLMAVTKCPQLANVRHVKHLPPSWGTLYQLSTLNTDPDEQDAA